MHIWAEEWRDDFCVHDFYLTLAMVNTSAGEVGVDVSTPPRPSFVDLALDHSKRQRKKERKKYEGARE